MMQCVDMNDEGDMVVTNEDPSCLMLLTTLWFTDYTYEGEVYTPQPEVHMTSWTNELRQRAHLAEFINRHNEWASEQEGRPVVKFAKQQVVLITPTTTELV